MSQATSANTGVGLYTSGMDYDVFVEWLNSNFQCGKTYATNPPTHNENC